MCTLKLPIQHVSGIIIEVKGKQIATGKAPQYLGVLLVRAIHNFNF